MIEPNLNTRISKPNVVRNFPIYVGESIDHPDAFPDGIFIDGLIKNQFGMEMGYIYLKPKGPELIKTIVSNELKNTGFNILTYKNKNVPELSIIVNQIFVETEPGYFAYGNVSVIDVNFTISNQNKSFSKRFKTIEVLNIPLFNNHHFLHLSLINNLEKFIIASIPDITEIYIKEFK
ncbi:YajG family lipoprotein [Leptospira limi]|uniref:YajG family lipoprotein n=1 Tax=Leptospira limi TaxID=2950023 RepID=A0ABT3LZI4_9LEPT|nr:YajG family lipoprotein [Leptospira limi]MCW7463132.1 YajG family lipoprotein [Leptospira limi]